MVRWWRAAASHGGRIPTARWLNLGSASLSPQVGVVMVARSSVVRGTSTGGVVLEGPTAAR